MSHNNFSFKTRLSGVFLATILLVSPIIASADVFSDIAARLTEAATSLNKIMTSLSSLSGGQQAQVIGSTVGTSGASKLFIVPTYGGLLNGTFIVPEGVYIVYITGAGGGGGGGGATNESGAGGGGGGATLYKAPIEVTPGQNINVNVGARGLGGGSCGIGTNGGTTSFGTFFSLAGGKGGGTNVAVNNTVNCSADNSRGGDAGGQAGTSGGNASGYNGGTGGTSSSYSGTSVSLGNGNGGAGGSRILSPSSIGGGSAGSPGFLIVEWAPTAQTPTITVIGTPTLALTYDSAGKEAALSATFDVTITAGSTNFKLYKYGAFDADTYAFLVTLNNAKGANNSVNNGNFYKTSGTATDNSTYWTIPAGQTATFRVTSTPSSPNILFSGSYNATISIYKPSGSVSEAGNIPNNTTNSLTIIGERAPYINSVSTITDVSGVVIGQDIWGVRFHPTSNQVTINGVTKTLPTGASDRGPYITFKSSDFGITSSGSYMVQVATAEGASNKIYGTITVPTVAATNPTATITASPTLGISYDSLQKEAALTATFNIDVTAGSVGMNLNKSQSPFAITLIDPKTNYTVNVHVGINGSPYPSVKPVDYSPGGNLIDNGTYWTIPAGNKASFIVSKTYNPKLLFAGTYFARASLLADGVNILTPQNNSSYQATIIGEVSPYISNVTSDANGNVTVTGARLNLTNNLVEVNGVSIKSLPDTVTSTAITFKASAYGLTNGSHNIRIVNSQVGNSNTVYFALSMTNQSPSIDTTPPSIPTGLSATAISASQINLAWNPSTDNVGVVGYKIYRNGTLIASLSTTSYSNTGLLAGTTYSYTVAALDAAGNISSQSSSAVVTTSGTSSPLSLTVTSPNGGETLFVGDTKTITWASSSVIDKVSIGWSTGPGSLNWIANNIPNTNSYNWNVNVGNTTNTQFKIWMIGYQTGTGSVTDESDNFFAVHSVANKTDLEIFKLCFGKSVVAGDSCAKTDFNADNFVDFLDLGLLKSALKYDMNGDSVIDLRDAADNADLNFLKSCFGQYTASSTSCTKADFDANGFINFADIALFKSAGAKGGANYDLNADSKVDLRESTIALPTVTSFIVTDSVEWPGAKVFSWTSTNTLSIDFIIDCASGLAMESTDNVVFTCGVTHSFIPNGQKVIKFKNTTSASINITAAVRAVGSFDYNPAAKNVYLTIPPTITTNPTADALKAQIRSLLANIENLRAQLAQCRMANSTIGDLSSTDSSDINSAQNVALSTSAITTDELQKHISLLLNIINRLNAQIASCGNTITTPPPIIQPPTTIKSPVFTERNLYRGMKGDGVKKLQELLAKDPQIYPSGQATGYYGYLTEAAVQNFQCKYGIVCSGDPETTGYGIVGPKTMSKINEVAGNMSGGSTGNGGTATTPSMSGNTVADLQAQIKSLMEQMNALSAKLKALQQ